MTPEAPRPLRILDKAFDPPGKDKPVGVAQTVPGITDISKDPHTRDRFLTLLHKSETDIDYSELLYAYGVLQSREQVKHLQDHWFGKGPGSSGTWWPRFQPIKPRFRQTMTEAFTLARATNKPILVYWIVPIDGVYEKIIENDTQIIILRFTPMPPNEEAANPGRSVTPQSGPPSKG